ncbi:MAG: adenosylcobinamide-phosphate synthase CbiB [Pseudomonadota bacterium]
MLLFDPVGILAGLVIALLLDAALGEPNWVWRHIPHPAIVMGRAVEWCDRVLNRERFSGFQRRVLGLVAIIGLLSVAAGLGLAIATLPGGACLVVVPTAILLAQRSLSDHVLAVEAGLNTSLDEGRQAVSMIVGRNPETLDEAGVSRAAIESCAENFSDGVVAPALWFLAFGLPGILAYKMLNTADSMIGHRTPRHQAFGWAAARLDDVANLIPARFSGVLIACVGRMVPGLKAMFRDAGKHTSPNAGWPEAAMAGTLRIALAGPRMYGETLVDGAWINGNGRKEVTARDVRRSVRVIWRSWAAIVSMVGFGAFALFGISEGAVVPGDWFSLQPRW